MTSDLAEVLKSLRDFDATTSACEQDAQAFRDALSGMATSNPAALGAWFNNEYGVKVSQDGGDGHITGYTYGPFYYNDNNLEDYIATLALRRLRSCERAR